MVNEKRGYLKDVNFGMTPESHWVRGILTQADITGLRSIYLERVYRAMAIIGRGKTHPLISQARVITREMIEVGLIWNYK